MMDVLIVDDDDAFTTGVREFLRLQGYAATSVSSLADAREVLETQLPSLLLLDLMLPDGSGLELLDSFPRGRPRRIVIVTGHSGVKSLIREVAGDGVSYLTKPVEPRELLGILNAVSVRDEPPAKRSDRDLHFDLLIGESECMQVVYDQIRQVAPTDGSVFIQGESGTGKELVAEAIHRSSGRSGPYVPVNCGGLARDLVSSQLFGHEKGSFTGATRRHQGFFERAHNGTLFLDEITEMPLDMQTHLLRVLETGKILRVGAEQELAVDARLVVATNHDPIEAVRDKSLREDLYFRLRVFPIHLPPLRERGEDVDLLALHFLGELNARHRTDKKFAEGAIEQLRKHRWTGNVRELKNAVHRSFILSDDESVEIAEGLDEGLGERSEGLRVGRSISEVEKDLILKTLEHLGGNKKAAAATLGVSLKTLYNRLKDYESRSESE